MMKMLSQDLSIAKKDNYMEMLSSFPNLFIPSYEEIRGFEGEALKIELKEGVKPVRQRLRRMGKEQIQALKEEVEKLLKVGFITPIDIAQWVSVVVITPKKDGRWRVCMDFKIVNATRKKNPYPLPFLDEILEKIFGHERYSVCDGFYSYF